MAHHAHSLRIIPQDQDTGGFFVAVLRKVADVVMAAPASVQHAGAAARAHVMTDPLLLVVDLCPSPLGGGNAQG